MHLCHHLKAFNIKTVRYDNETSTVSGGVMLKSASVSDTQRRKSGRHYYNTFYIKMKIKTLRYYMGFFISFGRNNEYVTSYAALFDHSACAF